MFVQTLLRQDVVKRQQAGFSTHSIPEFSSSVETKDLEVCSQRIKSRSEYVDNILHETSHVESNSRRNRADLGITHFDTLCTACHMVAFSVLVLDAVIS